MKNFLIVAAVSLALSGCSHSIDHSIKYVVSPNAAAQSVAFTCEQSTSGKCHVTFTNAASKADISVGDTITFTQIASNARYCAEAYSTALRTCQPQEIPTKRATVAKRVKISPDASE